jgi:hypothetical protein
MANPTSNFNWQMPTASDLVTDLPADFEVFGQAVDTSLADLKGGTTGQVLSKASNTNMDFTWVTTDDANAIQNSIVDAKGDIVAASANDTPARLAVGNNGETLVADSSTSTGLRYTAGTVQANPVLNSAMQIAQRGTSFTVTAGLYTLDRWQGYRGVAGSTITRQNTSDTTNLPNIQYCARVARNSGNTATNSILFTQDFETVNSIPYAGKTVTLSFYARAGANYSATSSILYGAIITGTGTDQNNTTGSYTGAAQSLGANVNLTTTWQRFTMTGTIPTTSTEMEVKFAFDPTGTAGANDYFEITGVQIDIGSVALPFRTYAATLQGELAACQRYYIRFGASGGLTTGAYSTYGNGYIVSTTDSSFPVQYPVQMRTLATSVDYANLAIQDFAAGVIAVSAVALNTGFNSVTQSTLSATISGGTAGRGAKILNNNNTSGYLGFSAEL